MDREASASPADRLGAIADEETEAVARRLREAIDGDRYPLSPRVQTLKAIFAKLRPEPARETLPPLKVYAPPRFIRGRRRRG